MHLYLTRRSHLNSLYVNDDGQVLYKVETPFKFVGLVSTIKSVLPGDVLAPDSEPSKISDVPPPYEPINDNDVEGDDEEPDDGVEEEPEDDGIELRYQFAHLAVIEYNKVATSVMRYHGEEYETSKFFTKKEYGWFGCHRAFTGPDGLEYQWMFGFKVPELVRRDEARTPIARFHRRHFGVFDGKPRRASLEIFPEGMHMVDLIVVTFVYIQKRRNEKASKAR